MGKQGGGRRDVRYIHTLGLKRLFQVVPLCSGEEKGYSAEQMLGYWLHAVTMAHFSHKKNKGLLAVLHNGDTWTPCGHRKPILQLLHINMTWVVNKTRRFCVIHVHIV